MHRGRLPRSPRLTLILYEAATGTKPVNAMTACAPAALGEPDRRLWLPVDVQLKDIRPRIVSGDIDAAPRCCDSIDLDVCQQHARGLAHRAGDYGATGRDHHRVAFVDPFVRVGIKSPALRKIPGQVAGPHDGSAADHPATSFARDVLQGPYPAIAAVVSWRDIYFEALRVERIPRQRHEVLPADERPDAPAGRVDDLEARSVAEPPHHALRICRHELAMLVEYGAVGANHNHGVVERTSTRILVTLVETADDSEPMLFRGVAQGCQVAASDGDRILQQPRVQLRRYRCVRPGTKPPYPGRIAGDECFREHHQRRALGSGLCDVQDGAAHGLRPIEHHRRLLDNGDLEHEHALRRPTRDSGNRPLPVRASLAQLS